MDVETERKLKSLRDKIIGCGESDEEVWQTTARFKVKTVKTQWAKEAALESNDYYYCVSIDGTVVPKFEWKAYPNMLQC